MTDRTTAYREVAGLQTPLDLIPEIVEAIRSEYPTLTEGIDDDDAAVHAVLKHWVTITFATHKARIAEAPVFDVVEATREDYRQRAEEARANALAAAARIDANLPATA